MTISEQFRRYALHPEPATLHPLQAAIVSAANFDPLVLIEMTIDPLLQVGDHQGVIDALHKQMPGVFLSPTAHAFLSESHTALGDTAAARREEQVARLALRSITTSGTGSHGQPYRVLRVSDEYDTLRLLQKKSTSQREVEEGNRSFDVHTTDDGTEVWFELLWRHPEAIA